MGFGGRRRSKDKEPEIPEALGTLWYGVWLVGLIGVGVSVAAMCLPDWRLSPNIQFRYMFRSEEKIQSYMETKWGLYNISFDGGRAMVSWPQRLSTSTEAITNAVRLGQQQTNNAQYQSWAAQCPSSCQDALTTRLACYKRISYINTLFLGILALGGALTLIGIGWFFLFGKMAFLMIGCWFLAGLLCFGIAGYWLWETDTCWNMIILSQQFPLPKLSTSFYMAMAGASFYILASILGVVADFIDRGNERAQKELLKQQALMEGGGGPDAFAPGMSPPGMAPGMGPPGMMPGGPMGGGMGGPQGMMGQPGMMGGPGMMGAAGMMGPAGMGAPMGRPSMGGPMGPMGGPMAGAGMAAGMGRGMPPMGGRPSMMGVPGGPMGGGPMMGMPPGKAPPMSRPSMRPPM